METNTKTQHVVPQDDKWAVRAESSEQPSKIFELKMDAISYAFDIADKHDGKVVIHRLDGTFQQINVTEDSSKLLAILTT